MPVTAKLSKHFYDKLGEQVVDEMVNWFNQVDATYKADLREFNEINFSRFDAKLEQRLTEFRAALDARIDRVYVELNAKIDHVAVQFDARLEQRLAELRADLIKWSFLFWAGTVITIVGAAKFVR